MALSIPIITEYVGKGLDKFKTELAQAETNSAKAGLVIKKAMIPATAAIGALGAALGDATKAAMEDLASQEKLATQLRTSTKATDAQIKSLEDWIGTQGKLYGFTDDQLRPALAKLVRVTNDVTRAQKLVSIAQDISAATGKDLESVTTALTKAEMGQFAALRKLGIPIGENTQALMDMASESKKVAKAQQDLNIALQNNDKDAATKATERLKDAQAAYNAVAVEGADFTTDLAKIFSGAAADAASTAEGRFKILKLQMDETKESIGLGLIPVIEAGLPVLEEFADWAQENPDTFRNIALAIGAIAGATVALNAAMAVNPYVLGAAGIVAFAAAFDRLYAAATNINKIGGLAARVLGAVFGGPAGAISSLLKISDAIYGAILPSTQGTPAGGAGSGLRGTLMQELKGIPAMAAGGVVTGPTLALIGEAGPEAVIPLDRMGSMGGGNNVTINVNGGDPQQVVNALRRYMQVNGSVPIRVAS